MFEFQVTNKQTSPDLFLEPLNCNKETTDSDTLSVFLPRNVVKEDDILCELYADTHFDVSDNSDSEILGSDSGVRTTSSHK
jgi:hypothetical protein